MEISKKFEGNELTYYIKGRIDSQTAPDLQEELDNSLKEAEEQKTAIKLVLDLEKVDYMSSAGLRTVLHVKKYIDNMENCSLKLINVQPTVMEVLDMTGFTDFLDLGNN